MDGRGLAESIFTKTLDCIMITEFHGEGLERRRVVREPCEEKSHARFDEEELEKQAAAVRLFPTLHMPGEDLEEMSTLRHVTKESRRVWKWQRKG